MLFLSALGIARCISHRLKTRGRWAEEDDRRGQEAQLLSTLDDAFPQAR
jgi:hypothetical protein